MARSAAGCLHHASLHPWPAASPPFRVVAGVQRSFKLTLQPFVPTLSYERQVPQTVPASDGEIFSPLQGGPQ